MRNQKGFTLIEIITVLIILGILAAVAVPKYIDLSGQAKNSAAQAEVAELKSTLNLEYAKLFMSNGTAPTLAADVITGAGFTSGTASTIGTAPDVWQISMTGATTVATLTVIQRGTDSGYTATGTWNVPSTL